MVLRTKVFTNSLTPKPKVNPLTKLSTPAKVGKAPVVKPQVNKALLDFSKQTISAPKPVQTTGQITKQQTFDAREKVKTAITSPFLKAYNAIKGKKEDVTKTTPFVSDKISLSLAPTKVAVREKKEAEGLGVGSIGGRLAFGNEETAMERRQNLISKARQRAEAKGERIIGIEPSRVLAKYLTPSEQEQLKAIQFTVAGLTDVSGGLSRTGRALSKGDDLLERASSLFGEKRTVNMIPPGRDGVPMQSVGREGIEVPATPPKKIDPIIEEAKKYKTAEEFVKADTGLDISSSKEGIGYGGKYTGKSEVIKFPSGGSIEFQNTANEVVIRGVGNAGNVGKGEATEVIKSLTRYAENNGKDIVVTGVSNQPYWLKLGFKDLKDFEYKVANKDIKSQLTDIFNKEKGKPLSALHKEAKKYKTAEEFVKAQGGVPDSILQANKKRVEIETKGKEIQELLKPYKQSNGLLDGSTEAKRLAMQAQENLKELQTFNKSELGKIVQAETRKLDIVNRQKLLKGELKPKSELEQIWKEANQSKQITQPTPKTKSTQSIAGERNLAFLKGGDEFNLPPKVELTESEQKIAEVLRKNKLNTAEASKKFKDIYKNKLDEYVQILKDDGFKGVEQGSLSVNADGEVVGRTGRMSNNPKWYRDYYAEFNRQPSEKALREIAEKHLTEGHTDDLYQIPIDRDFIKAKNLINNIDGLRVKLKGLDPELRKEAKAYYDVFEEKDDFVDVSVIAPELESKLNGIKERLTSLKDIGLIKTNNRDVIRNARQVLGKDLADELIIRPLDKANLENVEFIDYLAESLDANVVKRFGFKKGSKESADIMKYGEGRMTEQQLAKKYSPEKVTQIKEADDYFRNMYNNLIEVANEQIARIYPNNPDKLITPRKDYYRHFQEDQGIAGIVNDLLFNTKISGSLAGMSEWTKPKSKWSSIKQKRTSDKTVDDAIGGFINYIPQVSQIITIDPLIAKFRGVAQFLGQITDESKNINNFLESFNSVIDDLAGKTNFVDRPVQRVIGRNGLRFLNALNNRVKANQIVGNLGSVVAAPANIVNTMGQTSVKAQAAAAPMMLRDLVLGNTKSKWLKTRYAESLNKFDTGILENTAKFASWLLKKGDQISAYYAWNAKYIDELNKGLSPEKAIQSADNFARQISGGRALGEKPILQNSKTLQLVAPFQLEVGNAIWNLEDAFKNSPTKLKGAGAVLSIFLASFIYNKAAEEARGSKVTMDPIEALKDAYQIAKYEDGFRKVWRPAGRVAGEFISNIPFGQTVAQYYPEFGGDILPTRKELFGESDPGRFGTDPLVTKAIKEPLYFGVLPFGGAQVKKTVEAFQALANGEVRNKQGDLMFKLPATARNILQAPIMGKYSVPEGQEYFDEQEAPELIPARNLLKDQKETTESINKAVNEFKSSEKVSKELLSKEGIEKLVDSFKEEPDFTKEQKLIKQMNAETQIEYFNYKAETMEQKEFLKFLLKNIQDKSVKKEAASGLVPIINKINIETN
jgi:hypothetical protein